MDGQTDGQRDGQMDRLNTNGLMDKQTDKMMTTIENFENRTGTILDLWLYEKIRGKGTC